MPLGHCRRRNKTIHNLKRKDSHAFLGSINFIPTYLDTISSSLQTISHSPWTAEGRSSQTLARIKRWSLFLSAYEYSLTFRNTTAHANADALPETSPSSETPPKLTEHLESSPVTAKDVQYWMNRDPQLSVVRDYILRGWPDCCNPGLKLFQNKKSELCTSRLHYLPGAQELLYLSRGEKRYFKSCISFLSLALKKSSISLRLWLESRGGHCSCQHMNIL